MKLIFGMEGGIKVGKIKCTQYACLNNTGLSNSKIHYGGDGLCILDNPGRINFEATNTWG